MAELKNKLGHPPLNRAISIFTSLWALSLLPSNQPTHPSLAVMSEASKDFRATFDPEKQSMQDNAMTMQWIKSAVYLARKDQRDATNYSVASLLFDIGIEEALAVLDKVPKDELQANIDSIVQRINALEKTVTAKISILPAFDARMCMEAR